MSNETAPPKIPLARMTARVTALCVLSMLSSATTASEPPSLTNASFMAIDAKQVSVRGRPNEEARLAGLKSYKTGRYRQAADQFERAAYYADKYSQHYLSLMHWYGVGVSADPVEAYVWSDLAAERGSRRLLLIREKMWSQLTPEQQAQVRTRGEAMYARYGDDVAKPRAESIMRHFARDMTGSRVGYRNQKLEAGGAPIDRVLAPEIGSNMGSYMNSKSGSPDELYGKEGGLAMLRTYWSEQDRLIEKAGTVEVGPLKPVRGNR